MRILHITRSMSATSGGTAEAVRLLCQGLAQHQVVSEIASLDMPGTLEPSGLPDSTRFHCLGAKPHGYGYSARLKQWLESHAGAFDALLVHGLWQYSSFGAWRAIGGKAKKRNAEKLISVSGEAEMLKKSKGMDNGSDFSVSASQHFSSRPPFPPYFVFPHGMLDPWFRRTYPLKHLKKCIYWWLVEGRVFRDAPKVLFTSALERDLARGAFYPYQCRESVVPLGIESPPGEAALQRRCFLEAVPDVAERRFFLFLGRLHPKKGPELLIRAFAHLMKTLPQEVREGWALVMAGPVAGSGVDSTYLAGLQDLARTLLARDSVGAKILFPGLLQGDAKWGAFRACEAFVLPSHQENFGIAVVEALACGKPVLISDQINIWHEIHDDGAAIVDQDTEPGTLSMLTRWMELSSDEKVIMGKCARSSFEKRFEAGAAAKLLLEVLTDAVHTAPLERTPLR